MIVGRLHVIVGRLLMIVGRLLMIVGRLLMIVGRYFDLVRWELALLTPKTSLPESYSRLAGQHSATLMRPLPRIPHNYPRFRKALLRSSLRLRLEEQGGAFWLTFRRIGPNYPAVFFSLSIRSVRKASAKACSSRSQIQLGAHCAERDPLTRTDQAASLELERRVVRLSSMMAAAGRMDLRPPSGRWLISTRVGL